MEKIMTQGNFGICGITTDVTSVNISIGDIGIISLFANNQYITKFVVTLPKINEITSHYALLFILDRISKFGTNFSFEIKATDNFKNRYRFKYDNGTFLYNVTVWYIKDNLVTHMYNGQLLITKYLKQLKAHTLILDPNSEFARDMVKYPELEVIIPMRTSISEDESNHDFINMNIDKLLLSNERNNGCCSIKKVLFDPQYINIDRVQLQWNQIYPLDDNHHIFPSVTEMTIPVHISLLGNMMNSFPSVHTFYYTQTKNEELKSPSYVKKTLIRFEL